MKKVHYAWIVCIGCGLILFCNAGLTMGGFIVYLPYIAENGHFTNMQTSLLMTVRSLAAVCGTASALRVVQKFELRKTALLSGILGAGSFLVHSVSGNYFVSCIGIIMAGFTYGMGSILISGMIISRWFHKSRALAMGIAVSGTGIAMTIAPPLAAALIAAFGLSWAFRMEAVFIIVVISLATFLVKDAPEKIGLEKYGASDFLQPEAQNENRSDETSEPVLSRYEYGVMILAVFLIGASEQAYSQLSMLFHASHYSDEAASMFLSYIGIMIIVGKILYGRIADTLGSFTANGFVFGAMILGIGLCLFAGAGSIPLMFIAMTFFGLSIPLHTVGLTTLAADTASSSDFPNTLKTYQTIFMCGSLVFSIVPGFLADLTGSYVPAYGIIVFITLAAFVIVVQIYKHIGKQKINRRDG